MNILTFLPIIAAGLANLILGYIWYHPKVFGSAWMRLSNVTPEMAEKGGRRSHLYGILALVAGMAVASVMSYLASISGTQDPLHAIYLGALLWVGFIAPTMLGTILWDHKSIWFYCINAGYWLVSFIVIALILIY